MASSYESAMPSARINGLSGIQTTPPDMHVDPPTSACFSSTSASAPASAAASAATRPPPPEPAITKSTAVSQEVVSQEVVSQEVVSQELVSLVVCSTSPPPSPPSMGPFCVDDG